MDFSSALLNLKAGDRTAREGWNGKDMWLVIIDDWTPASYETAVAGLETAPFIAMKTADNKVVPWLASQTDLLAEDWVELEAAEARAEAAEAALRIANRGGLDLLYAIREAVGWTDKHALSLLPDECRRLKAAASRKTQGWPGKNYDHSQPGGFDGPTGAD